MSVEDRLRDILYQVTEQEIAQIKEAFHEAGYRWLPKQPTIQRLVDEGLAEFHMTGQEWFTAFERELYKPKPQVPPYQAGDDDGESRDRFYRAGGTNFMYNQAIEAAKRASGLK